MLGRLVLKTKKYNGCILSQSSENHSPCHPPSLLKNVISVRFVSLEHIHLNSISLVRVDAANLLLHYISTAKVKIDWFVHSRLNDKYFSV